MRILPCLLTVAVLVLCASLVGCCCILKKDKGDSADEGAAAATAPAGAAVVAQTRCPVMGGTINKEIYADYEGRRVYFCCKGCVAAFGKDPARYVAQLDAERAP